MTSTVLATLVMLIKKMLFDSSAHAMATTRSLSIWTATHDRPSAQLYICNYHNKWEAPFRRDYGYGYEPWHPHHQYVD